MYKCECCNSPSGEMELYNHDGDDALWCLPCLEEEQRVELARETYERLATAGLAHVFESAHTMVSQ